MKWLRTSGADFFAALEVGVDKVDVDKVGAGGTVEEVR